MLNSFHRISILCGHSGTGKTTLTLNFALEFARMDQPTTVIDLDVVNPYFRSSDYRALLEGAGCSLVAPQSAGSTLDVPSLSGAVDGALDGSHRVLIDGGGDDIGMNALARFAPRITGLGPYSMLYVINAYRSMTETPELAVAILGEIETAARLKVTGIINNSHLGADSRREDIITALPFAKEVSHRTGLPLVMTAVPDFLAGAGLEIENAYPISRLVKNPWE